MKKTMLVIAAAVLTVVVALTALVKPVANEKPPKRPPSSCWRSTTSTGHLGGEHPRDDPVGCCTTNAQGQIVSHRSGGRGGVLRDAPESARLGRTPTPTSSVPGT